MAIRLRQAMVFMSIVANGPWDAVARDPKVASCSNTENMNETESAENRQLLQSLSSQPNIVEKASIALKRKLKELEDKAQDEGSRQRLKELEDIVEIALDSEDADKIAEAEQMVQGAREVAQILQSVSEKGHEVFGFALRSAGCGRIFIDLGANVGDTITRFVHAGPGTVAEDSIWAVSKETRAWNPQLPSLVEPASELPNWDYRLYDFTIMRILNETKSMPKEYCLVGVDANPYWKPHYDILEKHLLRELQTLGRAELFSGLAVGLDQPRVVKFECTKFDKVSGRLTGGFDPAGDHLAGRSEKYEEDSNKDECLVPVLDVETYLRDMAESTSPPTTVILKVDLEGAEVNILKTLIKNRAFCKFPRGTDIHLIAHEMEKLGVDRSPAGEFPCGVRIYTVHPGLPCGPYGERDSELQSCMASFGWPWALLQ